MLVFWRTQIQTWKRRKSHDNSRLENEEIHEIPFVDSYIYGFIDLAGCSSKL